MIYLFIDQTLDSPQSDEDGEDCVPVRGAGRPVWGRRFGRRPDGVVQPDSHRPGQVCVLPAGLETADSATGWRLVMGDSNIIISSLIRYPFFSLKI